MKDWVTIQEAARLLKVSTKTIQRRVKDGTYKSRKNGQTREVVYHDLGVQGENIQPSNTYNFRKEQSEFLKEGIRNQQKHIESQDERISEVNKLILGIQGQVTQLNQNLQLVTSAQSDRTQDAGHNEKNAERVSDDYVISTEPAANGEIHHETNDFLADVQRDNSSQMNHQKMDKMVWKKYDHFERYQNVYLIIVIVLAVIMIGLIAWQTLA